MNSLIWIILVVQAIASGAFAAFVASQKNRSQFGWFVSGFFFSFLALIAIAGVPALGESEGSSHHATSARSGDWICKHCGHQNGESDLRCEECGRMRT